MTASHHHSRGLAAADAIVSPDSPGKAIWLVRRRSRTQDPYAHLDSGPALSNAGTDLGQNDYPGLPPASQSGRSRKNRRKKKNKHAVNRRTGRRNVAQG